MLTSFGLSLKRPSPFLNARYSIEICYFHPIQWFSLFYLQLNSFRQLRNEEGEPLKDNHRPIQKLHDRKVMYRPKEE